MHQNHQLMRCIALVHADCLGPRVKIMASVSHYHRHQCNVTRRIYALGARVLAYDYCINYLMHSIIIFRFCCIRTTIWCDRIIDPPSELYTDCCGLRAMLFHCHQIYFCPITINSDGKFMVIDSRTTTMYTVAYVMAWFVFLNEYAYWSNSTFMISQMSLFLSLVLPLLSLCITNHASLAFLRSGRMCSDWSCSGKLSPIKTNSRYERQYCINTIA